METIVFELALTFYFAATLIGLLEIFKESKGLSKLLLILTACGFVLHTLNIIMRYYTCGYLPITGMHQATSFFAWCIVLIFLFLQFRYQIGIIGAFILPIVFILMLSSSTFPRGIIPLSPVLQSYWFNIHTVLAFSGNASFAIASGVGVMYLLQEYYLKSKRLGGLFRRLPNLQILDEINYRLITIGFPLLTIAIITGVLWAESAWGSYWRWDPKEVWSLITWTIYALVLHLRAIKGWRGKKAAILSIIGFLSVLFTFFGVNLLFESLHIFG
ncbi:MAG: c-type cytochrome biogenesis protein CcsB [Thermodesulfovibrionales bacterium]|nr:c-type cytochrome biogenesis protein CcsB [Thermodesulfovibrionales bacterium]